MSLTIAGLDTLESRRDHAADRALLPAQRAAGDVMSALPPTGQARRLCHGQTATCQKF